MVTVGVEEPVGCVPPAAARVLEKAVRAIGPGGVLRLRVPFAPPGRDPAAVEQDVRYELGYRRDDPQLNEIMTIGWQTAGVVPLPAFAGTIQADWNADGTHSVLRLDGTYTPPAGLAGEAFDRVAGSRLADATAHEFLKRVAREVEAQAGPAGFRATT